MCLQSTDEVFHLWIDADVTIDLLCSDLLGGADIGGKVLFLGLVCESGELLSGVARRQCVAPRVRTRQPAHVVTHESRLSRGGFAVEKERISFAHNALLPVGSGLPAGTTLPHATLSAFAAASVRYRLAACQSWLAGCSTRLCCSM